jgi:uridine kinase
MNIKYIKELVPEKDSQGMDIIAALYENMVVHLSSPCCENAKVTPLTRKDPEGLEVYASTLLFLMAECACEIYPDFEFRARHSVENSIYCTLVDSQGNTPEDVASSLSAALKALVKADVEIEIIPVSYREAVETLKKLGRSDELELLFHRNPPTVLLSACGDFRSLNQGPLAPRSGMLDKWEIIPVPHGVLLNIPTLEKPDELPNREELFKNGTYLGLFKSHLQRGKITGVETIGDLNRAILEKRFNELVRICETMHTKELSRIADEITSRSPAVRLVLVAGPSSAGKTTTSTRICTQLRVNGMKPLLLSTDSYFVGDSRNPRDEEGNLDYETIEAVDRVRLSKDLNALFAGEGVYMRRFNFIEHEGYDDKEKTFLPPDGVVVIEGIHALNPLLTEGLGDFPVYRLYLNALTHLVIDSCNRIPTSDSRLLRRLVRDAGFRGMSPLDTFRLWPKVMEGERKWIYPFQHLADAVFNSALDYEVAVLKPYALELLNQVKPWDKEYVLARRLSGRLHNVSLATASAVPGNSILRETIGGSQLEYQG